MPDRQWSTGSRRDSQEGKGRWDLISPVALRRLALRLEEGAQRYGERNWEKGQPLASSYADSAIRHLYQWLEGREEEDHLAAAFWNIHAALHTEEAIRKGQLPSELDDRPLMKGEE